MEPEIVQTPPSTPPDPPETPKPPGNGKAEEEVSSKFAALAKKDKIISKRTQELAAQEKSVKEMLAKADAENKRWADAKARAIENPLEAMRELGLTYEQVTEFILNKEKPTPNMEIAALRKDLETLRQQQKEEKENSTKAAKEQAEKQNQETIENFKSSLGEFVSENKDSYELLNALEDRGLIVPKDLIFRGIQMVHRDKGVIPTNKEAADGVQEYLLKEIENVIQSVKYFKDKYGTKEPTKELTPDGSIPTTTLSNSMSPGMGANLPSMTEEQRIQRALQAMSAAEKS